jgi:hypothetical protein
MKRCHSLDCSGEDADADPDKWISYGDATCAAPPSPPLPSSPCTAAHTAFAYASTDNALTGDGLSLEHSPVPALCHEDSSCSGSDSDDYHWLNKCTLQTYGAEDRQLSPIERDSDQVTSRLQLDTINLSLNSYEQEEGSMTPKPRKDSSEDSNNGCTGRKSKYNLSKFSRNDELFECEALGGF